MGGDGDMRSERVRKACSSPLSKGVLPSAGRRLTNMKKARACVPGLFHVIGNLARKCNPVHRGALVSVSPGPRAGLFAQGQKRARTKGPTLRGGPMGDLYPEFSCPGEGAPCCPRGRCHLISG